MSGFLSQVRQTAVSHDGSTALACCEDGTIWRWDATSMQHPSDNDAEADEMDADNSSSGIDSSEVED